MKNLKTQGFVLFDTDVAALNNSGKDTLSAYDNAVGTKKISKNGKTHVYVSGQAWRYWWRQALQNDWAWDMSPIDRKEKVAYTAADPIAYADDDMFGYMRATKEEKRDEEGNVIMKKGKPEMTDATVTRVSPMKNSALVSVGSVSVAQAWSSMARMDGDAVPYRKDEYSAVLKGMFSIDLQQVGTFASYNRTGYKNLTTGKHADAVKAGAEEIADETLKDTKGDSMKMMRLPKEVRLKRVNETLKALKTLSGGAMQTSNYADVTPKFIVLATLQSGNHPFNHIVSSAGMYGNEMKFDAEALAEVLRDYADQITGNVYVGHRKGFMNDAFADLKRLEKEFPDLKIGSVGEAIEGYCKELEQWMP